MMKTNSATAPTSALPSDRLREIARCCLEGEPLNEALSLWIGEALKAYLDNDAGSLEDALGLKFGRGGVTWRAEAAIRMRDSSLRELAECFFADMRVCARSHTIAIIAVRYAASAWRIDRNRSEMPARYAGRPEEFLWLAFKSGARMPLGDRRIRDIIS